MAARKAQIIDPMATIRASFFIECEEQLAELKSGLMAMERGAADPETVNAVFRAVHSIKGGASAFQLDELVRFAHVFETTLDAIRAGRLGATPAALGIMLRAADTLTDLVRVARDCGTPDAERIEVIAAALDGLIDPKFEGRATMIQAAEIDVMALVAKLQDSLRQESQLPANALDRFPKAAGLPAQAPVRSVFQNMPRLVRRVAAQTGKQVRLVTEGEATEVDKTVIERLANPLTHLIRNAIDHGLESPEKRVAAGKSPEGTVRLHAFCRSGCIVIEVTDDGAGINSSFIREKAIQNGVIAAGAVLTDAETNNLIFLPGFSTANAVSDISGRGVGMDVVQHSVQALGGRITITSRPGLGCTFTLSLPESLAALDGMG